jgi:serine/threonine-protein kinase
VAEIRLPRTLGRYTLFDFVGRGGMAEIYLARQKTDLGAARHAVVKVILPEIAERKEFGDMLVAEAKLAATLNHTNIVHVHDLGRADAGGVGQLFIAMEYVEGFDLAALLRRCSREKVKLPIEYAMHVILEALAGLDYAHRQGVVHRDVSPSNILISFEGEVKVCDFGIARANALAEGTGQLADEAIKGKAGYMSPEQARGEDVDARSDVFAAGILLWELLQGKRMYKAEGHDKHVKLLAIARAAEIPALETRSLPDEERLFGIVRKALAPSRDDRWASAAAMRKELEGWVKDAKLGASVLKLGEWLTTTFGEDVVSHRRARERAVRALETGPAARVTPIVEAKPEIEEPPPESLVATSLDATSLDKASEPKVGSQARPAYARIVFGLLIALTIILFVWQYSR